MRRSRSAAAVVYRATELLQSGPQERAPETELIPLGIFGIPLRFRVESCMAVLNSFLDRSQGNKLCPHTRDVIDMLK